MDGDGEREKKVKEKEKNSILQLEDGIGATFQNLPNLPRGTSFSSATQNFVVP